MTEAENTKIDTDPKILLDTVMLEGTLMLSSGAEVYRVEDTMRRTLRHFGYDPSDMLVITTGIFVTLNNHLNKPLTMVKRISKRGLNINKICEVNNVSRDICEDRISLADAKKRLNEISGEEQYKGWLKTAAIIVIAAAFTPLFSGGRLELIGAAISGVFFAGADYLAGKTRINDFCRNLLCAGVTALTALLVSAAVLPGANSDIIIISSIMPLVPGAAFLTAIRDMLNGDYSSGTARMTEAAVSALAVAAGVGFGIKLYAFLLAVIF